MIQCSKKSIKNIEQLRDDEENEERGGMIKAERARERERDT
jgi:hypothetical protein